MRKFEKYLILSLILLLIFSLTVGCSSKGVKNNQPSEKMDLASSQSEKESTKDSENSPLEPDKVITTVCLDFETTEFEKATKELNLLIKKYKAYTENSQMDYNRSYNNKSYKSASYVIRVPKDKVLDFKSELSGVGNIISENTFKEDVTKQYEDSESRLRIIEVKEERILALLDKAEKIEDIIKLENQLNEIIYEKENLKTNLMHIDDQVNFSTLEVHIQEVEKLSNQATLETGFGTRAGNAFNDSLYFFKKSFERLIISLIYILPFAIIIGVVAWFIFKILKRRKNIAKK